MVLGAFEVDIIETVLDSFGPVISDSVLDGFEVSTALLDGLDEDPTLTLVLVVIYENVRIDSVLLPSTALRVLSEEWGLDEPDRLVNSIILETVVVSEILLDEYEAEVTELDWKLDEDDELERLDGELDTTFEEASEEVRLDKDDEMTDLDVAVAVGDEGALVWEEIESLVDDASVVVLPNEETGILLIDDARVDEELKLDGDELEVDGRETELNDRELENEDGAERLAFRRLKTEELDLEDEKLGLEHGEAVELFNTEKDD
ncbi:hypothetical protein KCU95_g1538, partial [Aureobasidium melanogenum]